MEPLKEQQEMNNMKTNKNKPSPGTLVPGDRHKEQLDKSSPGILFTVHQKTEFTGTHRSLPLQGLFLVYQETDYIKMDESSPGAPLRGPTDRLHKALSVLLVLFCYSQKVLWAYRLHGIHIQSCTWHVHSGTFTSLQWDNEAQLIIMWGSNATKFSTSDWVKGMWCEQIKSSNPVDITFLNFSAQTRKDSHWQVESLMPAAVLRLGDSASPQ